MRRLAVAFGIVVALSACSGSTETPARDTLLATTTTTTVSLARCEPTKDAATAAAAAYYATNGGYPTTFRDMVKHTPDSPPVLELSGDSRIVGGDIVSPDGWRVTMTFAAGGVPTFVCSADAG